MMPTGVALTALPWRWRDPIGVALAWRWRGGFCHPAATGDDQHHRGRGDDQHLVDDQHPVAAIQLGTSLTISTAAPGSDDQHLVDDQHLKWTQSAVARVLGVAQQTISDWFTSNTGSGNTCKLPAVEPTVKPDARVKLPTISTWGPVSTGFPPGDILPMEWDSSGCH